MMDQACSGLQGSLEGWKFKIVETKDGSFKLMGIGPDLAGLTNFGNRTIYLSDRYWMDERIVRHEMLHVLLKKPGHPQVPFVVPCDVL
jgi:hypothetical protein